MSRIGKVDVFEAGTESWTCYNERLDQYFVANEVSDDKKVPALLSLVGPRTYGVLRDLTSPDLPKDKTYDELCSLLNRHFNPEPLVIAERFRFHKCEQKQGESITDFNVSLRKLSLHCKFGLNLNDTLRDRLVCGLLNEQIQKRLLSAKDLTYDKALEIAMSMESAQRDVKELHGAVGVNKLFSKNSKTAKKVVDKTDKTGNNVNKNDRKKPSCYRCNRNNHAPDQCRFIKAKCNKCDLLGHIAAACKTKNPVRKRIHNIEEDKDDYEECLYNISGLFNVSDTEKRKPIRVCPNIDGKDVEMELDTGAGVSVMCWDDFSKLWPGRKLDDTTLKLKTYSGEQILPEGKLRCKVQINGQAEYVELYIVKNGGKPLFGREWLHILRMDWKYLKSLTVTSKSNECNISSKVEHLKHKYEEVFRKELGHIKGVKAKLYLKENTTPKFVKARSVPFSMKSAIETELDKLVKQGVMAPVEFSDWATPIVPVPKADGSMRICGDFKVTINPHLNIAQYPLPKIDNIFANLQNGKRYTKIDLKDAYLQMEVDECSQELLTISTHKGLFRYQRLVFGVASAPAIFQRTIEQIISGIPGVQVILDDMIVTGRDDSEHLENLEAVLKRLKDYGVRLNENKCAFFRHKISFCGHEIDENGLHKTQDKIDAIVNAPEIKNVTQLRAFLGLVQYYGKFLKNLSMVLKPLHDLLKKDTPWNWSDKCKEAVETVKKTITSEVVLAHYDPQLPIVLACDASSFGIGCVLSHVYPSGEERPIAFGSRSLSDAEKNYSQVDKEALSIVWGVKKFEQYLAMRRFTIVTDNKPLLSIFNPSKGTNATTAARLQRYSLYLAGFDYEIKFKNTKSHGNCDALSRLPLPVDCNQLDETDELLCNIVSSLPVTAEQIARATKTDPVLSRVFELVSTGCKVHYSDIQLEPFMRRFEELSLHQNCVLWGYRVIVPQKLQQAILSELHEGHLGLVKMKSLARSHVWWPNLDRDLEHMAKACPGCMVTKSAPPEAPIHPWEVPTRVWSRIHIDFAGPIDGYMLFIVVDAYSKWPVVKLMKSCTAARTVEIMRAIFSDCGVPDTIVSDNGPQFISSEFKDFLKKNGVKHITSAPYHPKTNGLAERFVQSIKQSLKASKLDTGTLQTKISRFLLQYRNAIHPTTKETPAQLFLGRRLMTKLDRSKPNVQDSVEETRVKMVRNTRDRNFEVGQTVSVRDYRERNKEKWIVGTIAEKTGPVSFLVEISPGNYWRRHSDQIRDSEVEYKPMYNQIFSDELSSDKIHENDKVSSLMKGVSQPIEIPSVSSNTEMTSPRSEPVINKEKRLKSTPIQEKQSTPSSRPKRNIKPTKRLITEM